MEKWFNEVRDLLQDMGIYFNTECLVIARSGNGKIVNISFLETVNKLKLVLDGLSPQLLFGDGDLLQGVKLKKLFCASVKDFFFDDLLIQLSQYKDVLEQHFDTTIQNKSTDDEKAQEIANILINHDPNVFNIICRTVIRHNPKILRKLKEEVTLNDLMEYKNDIELTILSMSVMQKVGSLYNAGIMLVHHKEEMESINEKVRMSSSPLERPIKLNEESPSANRNYNSDVKTLSSLCLTHLKRQQEQSGYIYFSSKTGAGILYETVQSIKTNQKYKTNLRKLTESKLDHTRSDSSYMSEGSSTQSGEAAQLHQRLGKLQRRLEKAKARNANYIYAQHVKHPDFPIPLHEGKDYSH